MENGAQSTRSGVVGARQLQLDVELERCARGGRRSGREGRDCCWGVGAVFHASVGTRCVLLPSSLSSPLLSSPVSSPRPVLTSVRFPGIGLQVHEAPYLNSGNRVPLLPGMTFSNEPGIYIEGELGVRLEDMVRKTEEGWELLSGSELARSPWEW